MHKYKNALKDVSKVLTSAKVTFSFRGKTWKPLVVNRTRTESETKADDSTPVVSSRKRRWKRRGGRSRMSVRAHGGGGQGPKRGRGKRGNGPLSIRNRVKTFLLVLERERQSGVRQTVGVRGDPSAHELWEQRWGPPSDHVLRRIRRREAQRNRRADAERIKEREWEKSEEKRVRREAEARAAKRKVGVESRRQAGRQVQQKQQEQAASVASGSGASCWCGKVMPPSGCIYCNTRKNKHKPNCVCR